MKKESMITKKVTGKPSRIMGPVDFLIVRFPGNKFSGLIAPELKNLGGVEGDAFSEFAQSVNEWLSDVDIEVFAESLPNNCSGAILLYENTWAIPFKNALMKTGAELVDHGRIPPELIQKVEQDLITAGEG